MLDIKLIRENQELVKSKLSLRGEDVTSIDKITELDKERIELIKKADTLKELRNNASTEIGKLKSQKADEGLILNKMHEMKSVGEQIRLLDEELKKTESDMEILLRYLPNLPDDSVPAGKSEKDNVEIKKWGEKKNFDFEIKDHLQLGKAHDILDFERGAKITGSGFPLYKGQGAILERALINFMLDEQGKNGYREVMTPVLANRLSMEAAEKIPKFEEDMYHIEKDDLYAIPTAEVSILNIHRDEFLNPESLPVKYCGFTTCFRREAGSYGKDTKGFLRVHQFNKVELINFCLPENSYFELEKMLLDACGILEKLNVHYRVIELCSADLGFAASKCYDIEVWSYAEDKWLEASSVSNCTDFQARRAMVRFKKVMDNNKTKTEFTHILNGSGLATSRLMVALLEANQDKDGNISVPEVLRSRTGFDMIKV